MDRGDIPESVQAQAIAFAMKFCDKLRCPACPKECTCGRFMADLYGVMERWLRNWERQQTLDLHQRIGPKLQMNSGVRNSMIRNVMAENTRHPERRLSEPEGFEVDHAEGERWRRFRK